MWCSRGFKSRECNPNGNGIGLYICKKICEGLGGEIAVQSIVGQGTQFFFSIKATLPQGNHSINEGGSPRSRVSEERGDSNGLLNKDVRSPSLATWLDGKVNHSAMDPIDTVKKVVFQGIVFNIDGQRIETESGQSIPTQVNKMIEFLCHIKKER